MKTWAYFGLAAALVIGGPALAAEKNTKGDWAARVAELAKPVNGDVVFMATGDTLWNHKIENNPEVGLQTLFQVMRGSDIAFMNFEQVLADSGYPTIKEISKADPSIISDFTWAGANLVSLANNHMMDFGPKGLDTTLKTLDTAGIKHAGAGQTLAQALQPAVIEKKGLKVALLAFLVSPTLDSMATGARESSPGVAPIHGAKIRMMDGKAVFAPSDDDLHAMEDAIKAAKKTADVVAVSFHIHWGDLEEIDATGKQLIAHTAVDAGADMILGHGPHVVNGIEFYKGKPIIYSMGNLAFQFPVAAYEFFPDSLKTVKRLLGEEKVFQAMAVRMTLSSQGKLKRMEVLPLALSKEGDPRLSTGEVADKVFDRVTAMSKALGTSVKRQSWYAVVDLPQADAAR